MMTLHRRRKIGNTVTIDRNPHAQGWRAANDEPRLPFYRPEITLGEAVFMVVVGSAIVGAMHGLGWLIRSVQGWLA